MTSSRQRARVLAHGLVAVVLLASSPTAAGCGGRSPRRTAHREPTSAGRLWDAGRHALGVVLRHPTDVVVAPPADARRRDWIYCRDVLRAHGLDVDQENRAAFAALAAARGAGRHEFDALVVPGFTPLDQAEPLLTIHPTAVERLEEARRDLEAGRAPLVVVSGGNVHPEGTPVNEALQMKQWLLAHGVAEERVVLEPCARHSHTNLRNAGRFLLAQGLRRALVVTSVDQALYFGRPRSSSFDARSVADLGYVVGDLREVDDHRVAFVPSGRTFDRGPDPLDP